MTAGDWITFKVENDQPWYVRSDAIVSAQRYDYGFGAWFDIGVSCGVVRTVYGEADAVLAELRRHGVVVDAG